MRLIVLNFVLWVGVAVVAVWGFTSQPNATTQTPIHNGMDFNLVEEHFDSALEIRKVIFGGQTLWCRRAQAQNDWFIMYCHTKEVPE